MKRKRWPVGLILGGLMVGIGLAPRSLGDEEAPAKPELRVLFPADRSILETGSFNLICVQPKEHLKSGRPLLRVDGAAHPWQPYRAPVLVARLKLPPGLHRLQIGSRTLQVFVRGDKAPEPPADWKVFRYHPPTAKAVPQTSGDATKHDTPTPSPSPSGKGANFPPLTGGPRGGIFQTDLIRKPPTRRQIGR